MFVIDKESCCTSMHSKVLCVHMCSCMWGAFFLAAKHLIKNCIFLSNYYSICYFVTKNYLFHSNFDFFLKVSKRMHLCSETNCYYWTNSNLLTWWLVKMLAFWKLIIGSFCDCIMNLLTCYLVKLIRWLLAVNVSY